MLVQESVPFPFNTLLHCLIDSDNDIDFLELSGVDMQH